MSYSQITTVFPTGEDSTVQSGGVTNVNPGQNYTISLGRFDDSLIPEFRPKVINLRVADRLQFHFVSPLEPFNIVEAVSSEFPCVEKPGGTYVGAMSSWTMDADGTRRAVDFAWVMPPVEHDVIYLFSAGHCESEDMRAVIFVDRSGWADGGVATLTATGYSAPMSVDSYVAPGLSRAGLGAVVGGTLLFVLILGAIAFALVRRKRAKRQAHLRAAPPAAQTEKKSGAKARVSVSSVSTEALPPYRESDKAAHDTKDKAELV